MEFINYGAGVLQIGPKTTTFVCVFRGLYQFFSSASITWTAIFAVYLFMSVYCDPRYILYQHLFKVFSLFGWAIPAILDVSLLYLRDPNTLYCFPKMPFQLLLWGNFILIGCAFNGIMYLIVKRRYSYLAKAMPSLKSTPVSTKLSGYLLAFMCCESFNIASIVLNYLHGTFCSIFWLSIGSSLTLNSAGTLNCIVYGLTNKMVREYSTGSAIFHFFFSPILLIPYFFVWICSPKGTPERQLITVTGEQQPLINEI